MPVDEEGTKWSCEPCMRGHRSSKCKHFDRLMVRVPRSGRPMKKCPHNREDCRCRKAYAVMAPLSSDSTDICRPVHQPGGSPGELTPDVINSPGFPPNDALVFSFVGNSPVYIPPIFESSPISIQAPDLQPHNLPAITPLNIVDTPELPDYNYVTIMRSDVSPWGVEGDGQIPGAWHHRFPDNGNINHGEESRSLLHLSANGSNGNPEVPAQVNTWISPPTVLEDKFSQALIVHPQLYQCNLDNHGFDPFHTPDLPASVYTGPLAMPYTESCAVKGKK